MTPHPLLAVALLTSLLAVSSSMAHAQERQAAKPQATSSSAVIAGRRDFLKWNCYSCHGINGAGGMGPNIQQAESDDVEEAVLEGEDGGMPSFSKIATKTDAQNIAAYLASIGTSSEPTWVDWWNTNP
jgi:mono/diheme cytochrome c family protein